DGLALRAQKEQPEGTGWQESPATGRMIFFRVHGSGASWKDRAFYPDMIPSGRSGVDVLGRLLFGVYIADPAVLDLYIHQHCGSARLETGLLGRGYQVHELIIGAFHHGLKGTYPVFYPGAADPRYGGVHHAVGTVVRDLGQDLDGDIDRARGSGC